MVRLLVRYWLLFCFLGLSIFAVTDIQALSPELKASFKARIERIIAKHPAYVWGGADEEKGVDCSGYVWLGMKGTGAKRTTAYNMALGKDGWIGQDIEWQDSEPLDLVWWTFKPSRQHGHVGILWDGDRMVTHASPSRNRVVVDELKGSLWDDISKIRRLGAE